MEHRLSPSSVESSFYVAPAGSDKNTGTLMHPFATLQRAQIAAQGQRKMAVTIYLRGGIYRLASPLQFTHNDSRNERAPLVFTPYKNESPVIAGSLSLNLKWKPYRDGIFQAEVPAVHGQIPDIDQLFVNGRLQHMARYPNYNPKAVVLSGSSPDAIAPSRVLKWNSPKGGYVHAIDQNRWGSVHYRISGKDASGNVILEGGWQNNRSPVMGNTSRYVENIFEELDAPGEWFLDRSTGMLFIMPEAGVNLEHTEITGSTTASLIDLRGDKEGRVSHITFNGLTFAETSRTFMLTREPILLSDWCIYRGGAIYMEGTESCAVRNCDFMDIGGNAVFVSGYNRHIQVTGCKMTDIGASGICFVGNTSSTRSKGKKPGDIYTKQDGSMDPAPGPESDDYPADCLADDNLITRIGEVEKQTAGVEIDIAMNIVVSRCSIYKVPRAGINIGDGCWGGHLITNCDVFDTVRETNDHGAFNSWGRDRYWQYQADVANHPELFLLDALQPNIIQNSRWVCRHGWDIDLDDGSSNYIIRNNLCLAGGIKNREGGYRDVENNIMFESTFHPHVWYANSQNHFSRNIVMKPYQPIGMPADWGSHIDSNLLSDDTALVSEQKEGRDMHSTSGDPMFSAPINGNFQVKVGSPALKIGFVNFPMDRFGVVSRRLRAQAEDGFTYAMATRAAPSSNLPILEGSHQWLGATVKTVTTLGERSVAGLPDTRGVIFLSIPSNSPASLAGFKQNDVIWSIDGSDVSGFDQLIKLTSTNQNDLSFGVYHNQRLEQISVPSNVLRQ